MSFLRCKLHIHARVSFDTPNKYSLFSFQLFGVTDSISKGFYTLFVLFKSGYVHSEKVSTPCSSYLSKVLTPCFSS